MKWRFLLLGVVFVCVVGLATAVGIGTMGCGSSAGGGGTSVPAGDYTAPEEISAIPTTTDATSTSVTGTPSVSFKSLIMSLAKAATDPDTDYSKAETRRFIEEHALKQFDILESIFSAVEQTHYVDEVGNGPYTAKVAFEDEQEKGGTQADVKRLQVWVVQSDWVDADGNVVTADSPDTKPALAAAMRARAWIEENKGGETELVKAELKITTPPERNADGSYAHYGAWTMTVKFGEGSEDYFVCSSELLTAEDGSITGSLLKLHDMFKENFPGGNMSGMVADPTIELKAILNRGVDSGYGKVSFPNFEALFGPETDPNMTSIPVKTAVYAYNPTHAVIKEDSDAAIYKDRNSLAEMVHRYGVFNKDTGEDINRSKSFGFPFRYEFPDGGMGHGYYGAWQGRHQIWAGMQGSESVPEGTIVYREDLPPEQVESYVVGPTYNGTLVKRTYVDASFSDIQDIPVEIWVSQDFRLVYANCDGVAGSEWCECKEITNWGAGECAAGQLQTFNPTILLVGENDTRKNAWINGFDEVEQENKNYVYVNGAGFYEAAEEQTQFGPRWVPTDTPVDTDHVKILMAGVGGNIYIEYKGADQGWVEKELISFDTMQWKPEFNDAGDKLYTLPTGRQLYINMEGISYVVMENGQFKAEVQTTANPVNGSTFVPAGTVFRQPWDDQGTQSTYEFITDPTNPNYLKLVYKTIGDDDSDREGNPDEGVAVGGVVTQSQWGLRATIGGVPTDFSWDYSESGGWGSVTYLMNADDGTFKLLDDPVVFDSVVAANGAGEQKTLALRYDGWMHGLPQLYDELGKNNWVMTDKIKNKIINLPEGMEVADSATGIAYLLKPLDASLFMEQVTDEAALAQLAVDLPLTAAEALDLAGVPAFVDHGMGATPEGTETYYVEGECIVAEHCGT